MSRRALLSLALLIVVIAVIAVIIFVDVSVCACAALPPTPTSVPAGATAEADTRSILFMSNRSGNWQIYAMKLADHSVTDISSSKADDGFASYSADGGALTFLSNRDGALNPYMMNADGSDQRAVANDLGTIMAVVTSGRLNWGYTYSGDQQTAFVSLRDLNLEVYTKDAQGEHNLTKNGAVDWFPAWSPDGKQIAFGSDRDGNQEIYVMNADGSLPRRLTNAPGDDLYPMWWNSSIVFMSDRGGLFDKGKIGLYLLNPSDANPQAQPISTDTTIDKLGEQFSGGSALYASNRTGHWDVYLADGQTETDLTAGSGDNLFPIWHP
ncbi:MAG TPA: hypothetical protein VHD90_09075 [Phototrophicaceae bacterium]|nr:hypothetical protein [Phototrophicaceae bacterium]